jgi:hypothetical protein
VQKARDELTRKVQEIAERRGDAGLVEEIRSAVGDGAESQVRGSSLDAMLVVLAETGAVTPSRLRALADAGERAQKKRLEGEEAPTREATPPVVSAPSVEPAVSPRSVPFQDPAFVQALEERRSLGLGPMRSEDED